MGGDKLHRLKGETNTGSYPSIDYTYDAIGNITSKTVGTNTMTYNHAGTGPHAVSSINLNGSNYNYVYDDNGNMTTGPDFTDPLQNGSRSITYNADNMPVTVSHTKGTVTKAMDLTYDGNGTRAIKEVLGGATTYYVGGHFQVKDTGTSTETTRFIFAGNLRVAQIKNGVTHFFHKDHLGSSTVMSNDTGTTLETTEYLPYGGQRSHTGTDTSNYKFTDQELDPESGLYNYNARLYDPIIGKFVTADTIVPDPSNPQTLNRYSYCINNPLLYTDPSGHWFGIDDLVAAVVGAVIGGVSAAINGDNILEGAAIGAVTAWVTYNTGGAYEGIDSIIANTGARMLSREINGGINSGDTDMGMVTGTVSGGLAEYGGGQFTGGNTSEQYGGSFGDEFMSGMLTRTNGYFSNHFAHEIQGQLNNFWGRFKSNYNSAQKEMYGRDLEMAKQYSILGIPSVALTVYTEITSNLAAEQIRYRSVDGSLKKGNILTKMKAANRGTRIASRTALLKAGFTKLNYVGTGMTVFATGYQFGALLNTSAHALYMTIR